MGFNSFKVRVFARVLLLTGLIFLFVFLINDPSKLVTAIVVGVFILLSFFELISYVDRTNRKLTRFLESVRYSDFVSGFSSGDALGGSFKELDKEFNAVLEAFRKARSEKEEHWQYLNTVVQQVGTGLLSFDHTGNIELINATAKKYLRTPLLHNIDEIQKESVPLYDLINEISPGANKLFRLDAKHQLAVGATELIMRGTSYKLITLQNIQPELQQNELDAWQKLTRVLRHEIMNSITPIASLTSTLKDILIEDLTQKKNTFVLEAESVDDLQEGLDTIESRSYGLIKFIDAYRDYTTIPAPNKLPIKLADLLEHISNLLKIEIRKANVDFTLEADPELTILADEELMEQVLINMVKNAIEATLDKKEPKVWLIGTVDANDDILIIIKDNGQGIEPEAIERIFIPFYTTKKSGSGIGLALSQQIVQMHEGTLSVESIPEEYTEFTLKLSRHL
jgi:nitrogen fixation/metabolism regulation signal transduction histidine kinase